MDARPRPSAVSAPALAMHRLAIAAAALCCASAWGQDAGGARSFAVTPTFAAEETYLETRSSPTLNGRESITRLAPGLRLASRSGRVQGSLDYAANLLYRAGRADTAGPEIQNALNARFVAEAVPNRAFVEARASISQQTISAFGQQSADGGLQRNNNRTEVANVSISPWLVGSLSGLADYELRLNAGATESRADVAPRSNDTGASLNLHSARSASLLGWSLSATQRRQNYSGGLSNDNSRLRAGITASPVLELLLSLDGGREVNDDAVGQHVVVNTAGAGLRWTPTVRTTIDLGADRRYFGHASHLSFEHRMPRSVWRYAYVHDATSSADATGNGRPLTLFQLLFDQAASAQPDPALREQAVLDLIRALGRNPNEVIAGGFLTSVVSLQRRQDLSLTLLGLRSTFSLQAFSSSVSSLSPVPTATDPNAGETVQQFGYTATISYRLTPVASVSLLGSRQKTMATLTRAGNDLKSASVSLSNQISNRTTAAVSARYAVFNSPTDPYRESAVTGTVSLRF